jgi:hypothetical protein
VYADRGIDRATVMSGWKRGDRGGQQTVTLVRLSRWPEEINEKMMLMNDGGTSGRRHMGKFQNPSPAQHKWAAEQAQNNAAWAAYRAQTASSSSAAGADRNPFEGM